MKSSKRRLQLLLADAAARITCTPDLFKAACNHAAEVGQLDPEAGLLRLQRPIRDSPKSRPAGTGDSVITKSSKGTDFRYER